MKTATFIRKLDGFRGDARLYRLSEPVEFCHTFGDFEQKTTDHVVVSAIIRPVMPPELVFLGAMLGNELDNTPGGEETFIFPCDAEGECYSMNRLPGSFQGGRDHLRALRGAGFEVTQ